MCTYTICGIPTHYSSLEDWDMDAWEQELGFI